MGTVPEEGRRSTWEQQRSIPTPAEPWVVEAHEISLLVVNILSRCRRDAPEGNAVAGQDLSHRPGATSGRRRTARCRLLRAES